MDPLPAPAAVPAPYALPAIPYLRLRCTLRAEGGARLPPFKGSLLRGAFGHALRRAVCAVGPEQPCPTCALRRACVYPRLFETLIEGEPPPFLAGLDTAPRPYVFEPLDDAESYPPGAPLPFDLLLFGQAVALQAYAVFAVERMAGAGLGADRVPFRLDRVEGLAPDGAWRELVAEGRAVPAAADLAPSRPGLDPLGGRVRLRFLTPTRIKVRGELAASVTFRDLAFAMLRRTLELAHFHVPGAELDWSFRPFLDRARDVRTAAARLAWRDWQRYSNRQGRKMTMGGFVGDLDLEGDLSPFAPLLRTAEVLHVGKGATFGLGRLSLVPLQ